MAVHGFHNRTGVVAYLTKLCDGIGERTADNLFAKYGSDAVQILRSDPDRVIADGHLREDVAREAAAELAREVALEHIRIDLFGLFQGRGFHKTATNAAIQLWGAKAPAMLRRDPFKALQLPGGGFKRCDKLWVELGLSLHRLKRQVYAALLHLIRTERTGITWLPIEQTSDAIVAAIGPEPTLRHLLWRSPEAGRQAGREPGGMGVLAAGPGREGSLTPWSDWNKSASTCGRSTTSRSARRKATAFRPPTRSSNSGPRVPGRSASSSGAPGPGRRTSRPSSSGPSFAGTAGWISRRAPRPARQPSA